MNSREKVEQAKNIISSSSLGSWAADGETEDKC